MRLRITLLMSLSEATTVPRYQNTVTTSRLSPSTNTLLPRWTESPVSRYFVFVALILNPIFAASQLSRVYASHTFAVVMPMRSMSSAKLERLVPHPNLHTLFNLYAGIDRYLLQCRRAEAITSTFYIHTS